MKIFNTRIMDITKMTAAERASLKAQLEAEERAEKQKREDDVLQVEVFPAQGVE